MKFDKIHAEYCKQHKPLIIVTDEMCCVNGKPHELMTLISLLSKALNNDGLDRELIHKAVDVGIDPESILKDILKEMHDVLKDEVSKDE